MLSRLPKLGGVGKGPYRPSPTGSVRHFVEPDR